jgi:hypothetical protein
MHSEELVQLQVALATKCAEADALAEELKSVKRQLQQHSPQSRPMSSVDVIQALNMQVRDDRDESCSDYRR